MSVREPRKEFGLYFDFGRFRTYETRSGRSFSPDNHYYTYPDGLLRMQILRDELGEEFFNREYDFKTGDTCLRDFSLLFTFEEVSNDPLLSKIFENRFQQTIKVSNSIAPHFSKLVVTTKDRNEKYKTINEEDWVVRMDFVFLSNDFFLTWRNHGAPIEWENLNLKKIVREGEEIPVVKEEWVPVSEKEGSGLTIGEKIRNFKIKISQWWDQ